MRWRFWRRPARPESQDQVTAGDRKLKGFEMRFEAKVGGKKLKVTIRPVAEDNVPGGITGNAAQAVSVSDGDGITFEISEDGLTATFTAVRIESLATVTVTATNPAGATVAKEYEVLAVQPAATDFAVSAEEVAA